MRVEPNTWVTVSYVLRGADGAVLDDGQEPLEYVHGYHMIVPGLEAALAGLAVGDARTISLEPEEAFGPHDEELVLVLDPSDLPKGTRVGDELMLEDEHEGVPVQVLSIEKDRALVDANHPLAGKPVAYDFEVLAIRAATDDEVRAAAEALDEEHEHDEAEALVQIRRKE
jgi:FKBP-type peptidyl-prolyl cis-trans isomerase SlyD